MLTFKINILGKVLEKICKTRGALLKCEELRELTMNNEL